MIATVTDPDLALTLPIGWATVGLDVLRTQATAQAEGAPEGIRKVYEQLIRDIDQKATRLYAFGPSGLAPWQATIIVEVTTATSVAEQAKRVKEMQAPLFTVTSSTSDDIRLAIGAGVRLERTAEPPTDLPGTAIASRSIDYIVKLDDGRILWVNSTAPQAAASYPVILDAAVTTLRRR